MKTFIVVFLLILNSLVFANNPYIWVAGGYSLKTSKFKSELTNYIEKLHNRINTDYDGNVGVLEGFYDFRTEEDFSKFYPINTSKTQRTYIRLDIKNYYA